MNLTEKPDVITWPEIHYAYLEKKGAFTETAPACWKELHATLPDFEKNHRITRYLSLYKVEPEMVYRAGVALVEKPKDLPKGWLYCSFKGGRYLRFVLKGPYTDLPEACGRVMTWTESNKPSLRDDFYIEHYVNDPRKTSEDQLITEILIPTL